MDPDGPDYEAVALRCRACEARDVASRRWHDESGDSSGLYFSLTRHDYPEGP